MDEIKLSGAATVTRILDGWTLETWPGSDWARPMLTGPADDIDVEIDDEGRLEIDGWRSERWEGSRINIPLIAISALMEAHAEWTKGSQVKR